MLRMPRTVDIDNERVTVVITPFRIKMVGRHTVVVAAREASQLVRVVRDSNPQRPAAAI